MARRAHNTTCQLFNIDQSNRVVSIGTANDQSDNSISGCILQVKDTNCMFFCGSKGILGLRGGSGGGSDSIILIGVEAGPSVTGTNSTHVGYCAGYANGGGYSNTNFGSCAGQYIVGGACNVSIGYSAGPLSDKSATVSIGTVARASGVYAVAIGSPATASNDNNIAIGGSARSTGTDGAIAIGSSSCVGNARSIAIGYYATVNNGCSVVVGASSQSEGDRSVTIGDSSRARLCSIAIGYNACASMGSGGANGIGIGYLVRACLDSTVIGACAYTQNGGNTVMGFCASTQGTGVGNVAMGECAYTASGINYSVVIGHKLGSGTHCAMIIGSTHFCAYATPGTGAWVFSSDRKLKNNIKPICNGLTYINKLKPVTFNLKNDKTKSIHMGFIAQDIEKATCEVGYLGPVGLVSKPDDNNRYYGLAKDHLIAPIVKAIQEQSELIEKLQKEIDKIKSKSKRKSE